MIMENKKPRDKQKSTYIPVVFICDKNFAMQTGVAITSVILHKNLDTRYAIYIILVDCEKGFEKYFEKLERFINISIQYIYVSTEKYRMINQMAHISRAGLIKFELGELIRDFNKVIYLDGDIIVRGDLTELYNIELGEKIIGGVKSLDMVFDNTPMINSGVMLVDVGKMRRENYNIQLRETRISLGDRKSMDQQTINIVFNGKILYLHPSFNCIPEKLLGEEKHDYEINRLNELYGTSYSTKWEMVEASKIIHYATSRKPWKYTFVTYQEDWMQCFIASGFNENKLKRLTRFEAFFKGGLNALKKAGIIGVIKRSIELAKSRFNMDRGYEKWG